MDELRAVDHLVIAGPDLRALGDWWSKAVGRNASEGGAHTGRGTRNLLAGIDETTYVELIGPDTEQPDPPRPRPFGIDDLHDRRLVTFALAVPDLIAACAAVSSAGIDPGEPFSMERTRPDGERLHWRLAFPPHPGWAGVMPFLIEWGETAHPAADLPAQVRLVDLSLQHPDAAQVGEALRAVTQAPWKVRQGPPTLTARLETLERSTVEI
ncbi:MAG: VOC family protein [Acidimicrobiia bacterium]|nr:VOC family protein [Acidimicrobiia bacterium]